MRACTLGSLHRQKSADLRTNLNSSVSVHVGLTQQRPGLSTGEVVAESPENVDDLRGIDAVTVVFVVEGERSLDRLQ